MSPTTLKTTIGKFNHRYQGCRFKTFDSYAISVIDFKSKTFESSYDSSDPMWDRDEQICFDLASITKPLTVGISYMDNPKIHNETLDLLLNHKGGIPAYGRLDKKTWKDYIRSIPIKDSNTIYSDFSALRLQLELEQMLNVNLKRMCSKFWDKDLFFWKDLPVSLFVPKSGVRKGNSIRGEVNDDNAFYIDEFCAHAGIFGTVGGLSRTLLKMDKELSLLDKMKKEFNLNKDRFILGFDTAEVDGLCGKGHSVHTFGHLGFTGTSFWVDCEKQLGHVVLTNATKYFYYDRDELNDFRREIGDSGWMIR